MKIQARETTAAHAATLIDGPFDDGGWVFETKWDGFRIVARIEKRSVTLYHGFAFAVAMKDGIAGDACVISRTVAGMRSTRRMMAGCWMSAMPG
jgi:hypothetical protein